ncbi:ABC transporter ATP-binding protein [Ramlibacter sp.]|uniref:ABC transporter ATP-binding protein n=1 Tax=Ramlibacter sp. TaxID=1917967 RepID=UPI002D13C35A|nr:ATP-binding cassette domain-containing protein [Ramlibacter sp.]HWI82353.1 ATP-binding cassette domain-containing protein [Ramlibacter sp.]
MIRTRSLRYAYRGGPALSFPDLNVAQGATLLLRGDSGAGKSTWLALAAGLLTPTDGEVVVAGQPLAALSGAQRDRWRARHVGFLPQRLHLSPALTVHGNLALAFYAAGLAEDAAAIGRALQALGVADLANRRPAQLSGGQAQRVALARSVLMAPRVVLADEPTASLDDAAAAGAVRLLREAAARCGATLVIATHDRRVQEALPEAALYLLAAPLRPQQGVAA